MHLTKGYWSSTEIKHNLSKKYEHSPMSDILHMPRSYLISTYNYLGLHIHNTVNYIFYAIICCMIMYKLNSPDILLFIM